MELAYAAVSELALEDPQGRSREDATEGPFHPARAKTVQVVDVISPGQQPGKDRGDLPDRVRRPVMRCRRRRTTKCALPIHIDLVFNTQSSQVRAYSSPFPYPSGLTDRG